MKLYLTRHGQTEWNAENKVCGRTDIGLTEKGVGQADELGKMIAGKGIDLIISSPMIRALKTAEIAGSMNSIPVITDERLIEQNYGIYEGVDRNNEGFLNNKRCFAFRYPGGESMMQVAHRVYDLIDEVKGKYKDKTVLFVCHNGVCRIVNTYFMDVTNEEFFNYELGNAELAEYDIITI